ncbi:uncharacterized protein LOC133388610 [Rhineura floridana]|uniref:uncharacterized protein LOC133388610 n=1 Tax=Rhineura floridana TaxID=261503 RepID=UPI002AC87131|nr:uncharacterized protein LOC133388610 [Rhineura floridana]
MDAGGKSQGKDNGGEGSSRMEKSCGETPVAGFAAESSSQLVWPLESQLVDPEEAKLESEVQKGGPVHEEEEGMKQCQLPTATSAEQQVPWFGFEKACTFVSQSGKNVVVRCNYCLPRIKNLRSAVSSSSNVKKHFERAHPEKLRAIEEAIKARRRGLPEPMHDTPPPKMTLDFTRLPQGYQESLTIFTQALVNDLEDLTVTGGSTLVLYVDGNLDELDGADAHDCQQLVRLIATPRPDLTNTPIPDPDLILFTDGFCARNEYGQLETGIPDNIVGEDQYKEQESIRGSEASYDKNYKRALGESQ